MVTPVPLHVTLDTNERGALRDHVKPTDSGQVNKLLVKVSYKHIKTTVNY